MAGTANSGGRNRKSRDELALAGTLRTDRHGAGGDMPDPPKGRPATPPGLAGHALAEWDRIVARLEASGTLSLVDDTVLYQYCSLFGETEDLKDAHRENAALSATLQASVMSDEVFGQIVVVRQLNAKLTAQLRQQRMALRSYLVELGSTPAARTRVKMAPAPVVEDPMAEFDETKP